MEEGGNWMGGGRQQIVAINCGIILEILLSEGNRDGLTLKAFLLKGQKGQTFILSK